MNRAAGVCPPRYGGGGGGFGGLGGGGFGGLGGSMRQPQFNLLDHIVGAGEQRRRHVGAERLCRLEIDGQVVGCLTGMSAGAAAGNLWPVYVLFRRSPPLRFSRDPARGITRRAGFSYARTVEPP